MIVEFPVDFVDIVLLISMEKECGSEYNTENDSEVEDSAGVPKEKKAKVGRGAAKYITRFDPS